MATLRGSLAYSSGHVNSSAWSPLYTGWTTANPATGDLLIATGLTLGSAQTVSQTGGTGTWTFISTSDANANATPFNTWLAWRVLGASDTSPTFGWTTGGITVASMVAFIPAASWLSNPVDATATTLVQTTAGATAQPGAATATGSNDLSVVLSNGLYATLANTTITTTAPAGWTTDLDSGYVGSTSWHPLYDGSCYKTPAGSGSVAPGVVTYSVALSVNVYHVLFTEGGGGGGPPGPPTYTAMMASS